MSGEGPADPSEMGRELRASELKAGMIVFIEPPMPEDQPRLAFTMWVVAVLPDSDLVVFFSGVEKGTSAASSRRRMDLSTARAERSAFSSI